VQCAPAGCCIASRRPSTSTAAMCAPLRARPLAVYGAAIFSSCDCWWKRPVVLPATVAACSPGWCLRGVTVLSEVVSRRQTGWSLPQGSSLTPPMTLCRRNLPPKTLCCSDINTASAVHATLNVMAQCLFSLVPVAGNCLALRVATSSAVLYYGF